MPGRLLPCSLKYILAASGLTVCLLLIVTPSLTIGQAAPQPIGPLTASAENPTLNSTYSVTSTADLPDADVGDGVCAAANGACTLRAAIMQANFVTGLDTITVPSGVYLLTRSGDDDAAVLGDLDIADDLTIQGAGSGVNHRRWQRRSDRRSRLSDPLQRERDEPERPDHSERQKGGDF